MKKFDETRQKRQFLEQKPSDLKTPIQKAITFTSNVKSQKLKPPYIAEYNFVKGNPISYDKIMIRVTDNTLLPTIINTLYKNNIQGTPQLIKEMDNDYEFAFKFGNKTNKYIFRFYNNYEILHVSIPGQKGKAVYNLIDKLPLTEAFT